MKTLWIALALALNVSAQAQTIQQRTDANGDIIITAFCERNERLRTAGPKTPVGYLFVERLELPASDVPENECLQEHGLRSCNLCDYRFEKAE